MTLSNSDLLVTLSAYEEAQGNISAAARKLGLTEGTVRYRLKQATAQGIGTVPGSLPFGMEVTRTTTLYGDDGALKAQWVQAKPGVKLEDAIELIKEAFDGYTARSVPVVDGRGLHSDNTDGANDLATVFPIPDLHLGMYSWAEETGQDYDLGIAERMLKGTMAQLFERSPPSDTAVILNLGDFFHSDNNLNRTARSQAPLDVDTRFAKVLQTGVDLMIWVILEAQKRYPNVIVRNLPGNHDPYASLALSVGLRAFFSNTPGVHVDADPSPFWFWLWGKTLIGATHGDEAKLEDMPGIMAAKVPQLWGASEYRYVYGGHWHTHKRYAGHEKFGADVEVFQTPAPKDDWNNRMGFVSGRSLTSITHHKDLGEWTRQIVNIKGPE